MSTNNTDFYKTYCTCAGKDIYLLMRNANGMSPTYYPVTVFNVNGVMIGSALNKQEYIDIWNNDTANQDIGKLSGAYGDFTFTLTLKSSNSINYVGGNSMRFYQFDLAYNNLDKLTVQAGQIVDFGDGVIWKANKTSYPASVPLWWIDTWPNGQQPIYIWNDMYNTPGATFNSPVDIIGVNKSYPDNSKKTITVYHSEEMHYFDTDNFRAPAASDTMMDNLRGNLPNNIKGFRFVSTEKPAFNTFANVNLQEFKNSVEYFGVRNGTGYLFQNWNFGTLDFPNLKGIAAGDVSNNTNMPLKTIFGTTEIATKCPKLISIGFHKNQYTSDVNFNIKNVQQFITPWGPYAAADVDKFLNQLAAGKDDTGGKIAISGIASRTAASAAAYAKLISKGVIFY